MRDFGFWPALFWDVVRRSFKFGYLRLGTTICPNLDYFTLEDGSDILTAIVDTVLGR
jgi:hypothetical protein